MPSDPITMYDDQLREACMRVGELEVENDALREENERLAGANDWLPSVWVVLDHRVEADRLVEKIAYDDRESAEARAHLLRQHYQCSLDAIQVQLLALERTGNARPTD